MQRRISKCGAALFVAGTVLTSWTLPSACASEPLPRVPAGFTVELVAGPPIVERPVMANFDDRGRLYVVDSAGVNLPFEQLKKDPPHRIVVLEDTNGDGRFDTRTVFADKLVMPQGVLWHQGAAYVASPPSVWKLEDTDGDGVADRRKEIVTEFGSNGNAADVHGPFLGPDGWLYLCDGRHGHKVKLADGRIDQGLAGGIFRFRTDGSGFERFCGGGFDNPVEIDFTPEGEMLGTVNILQGNPRVDCLMHWVEGGVYPRADQEQCLAEFKKTGDLLPPLAQLGHVAVSGMNVYRSAQFGPDYTGNVFIAIFNQRKVMRSIVERSGATFRSREEDFLVSEDRDFHPTDVLEDADGSLLVINTGGWFRIGCPTSQIAKPDIFGGIYRVRKAGAAPVADPRGIALRANKPTTAQLAGQLDDSRPALRELAVASLATGKADSVAALQAVLAKPQSQSVAARRNAVWALGRSAGSEAATALRTALRDPEESVRVAAVRAVGMTGDQGAVETLAALVVKDAPAVRREAATALGRLCQAGRNASDAGLRPRVLAALFDSLRAGVTDRFLEHALLFAAIQIADRDATLPFLSDASPRVRRGALIALDQMDGGNLTRELVTPLLDTDDPALQQMALAVISRHAGWAAETLTLLRNWLSEAEPAAERVNTLRGVLLAQSGESEIQKLVTDTLAAEPTSPAMRLLLWEVIHRAPLPRLPEPWLAALGSTLAQGSDATRREAIAIVRERELNQFDEPLRKLAADPRQPLELRIEACAATAPRSQELSADLFRLLTGQLQGETSPLLRLAAAKALADAPLDEPQLAELARELPAAGPLATPVLLRAFARSSQEAIGRALVEALQKSPSATNLAADELARVIGGYPAPVQDAARDLLKKLGSDLESQQRRLAELAPVLNGGNPAQGRAVFYSQKAACASCHAIGGQGGKVGPDLTKIGGIRAGRDLLEAITFPSASFAREFRSYNIVTDRGRVFTGVISRQTADAVYLRTAELAEIRVPRAEIDEMSESAVSLMPKGLDQILSESELRDLLAFLQQQK